MFWLIFLLQIIPQLSFCLKEFSQTVLAVVSINGLNVTFTIGRINLIKPNQNKQNVSTTLYQMISTNKPLLSQQSYSPSPYVVQNVELLDKTKALFK